MSGLVIGYPHGPTVHHCWHESLVKTINDDQAPGNLRGLRSVSAGAYSLDRARNGVVDEFLATDADWLLQIDTDMQWQPSDVWALLSSAHPRFRPVMGALCFRIHGTNPATGTILVPVLYRFTDYPKQAPVLTYSGIERVDVTGAAFLLAHRSVFERIGGRWFSAHPDQEVSSEDHAFCFRLREHGIPLHVDTRIKIGHEKFVMLGEGEYHAMVARMAADPEIAGNGA